MNDLNEVWAYDEPHPSGGNAHVTMTRAQAIAMDYPNVVYRTDEEIFDLWVVVNWAYKEDTNEIPT